MPRQSVESKRHQPTRALSLRKIWTLWEWWVVAMAIAQVVGLGMVVIASSIINSLGTVETVAVLHIVGLLEGIVLGFAQWLVLRHYIKHVGKWIIVTAIAALIAWLIGLKASSMMMFFIFLDPTLTVAMQKTALLKGVFLLGAGVGGVLGFAQWLVLKQHIHRAFGWVFANALAWALGLVIACLGAGTTYAEHFNLETALASVATGLMIGAVVGAITGITLIWLLKSRLLQRH